MVGPCLAVGYWFYVCPLAHHSLTTSGLTLFFEKKKNSLILKDAPPFSFLPYFS